jgi:hypothetical protein
MIRVLHTPRKVSSAMPYATASSMHASSTKSAHSREEKVKLIKEWTNGENVILA